MNINTITQEELDKVGSEYYDIAFQGQYKMPFPVDYVERMREAHAENPFVLQDGYRLGISGWPHTKLRPSFDADGTMHWEISPNADKLSKVQKGIIKKLEEWASKL